MYVKNRDKKRPVKHNTGKSNISATAAAIATGGTDEPDGTSAQNASDDSSGRVSPEGLENIQVQGLYDNFNLSNPHQDWPQNFENRESTPKDNTSQALPDRASKYVVEGTLRGLTGAKYIAVPQSDYKIFAKPDGSVHGTVKGYARPVGSIRVQTGSARHRNNRHIPDGTIRGQLSQSTGVRDYWVNQSVRPSVMQHENVQYPVMDSVHGTIAFRRYLPDRKESAIRKFTIELERPENYAYAPGEQISGKLIVELTHKIEIRFLELLIIGEGQVRLRRPDPSNRKSKTEVFLNKRSYVFGSPDARWNSVISEGMYVSNFKFVLPKGLPSTLAYEDPINGFSFEISYMVKARICDEFGSASVRSTHSLNNYVKVLFSKRFSFLVRRPFDINAVPNALTPVSHTEDLDLLCFPFSGNDSTMISLHLDRSVFLAGDEIRVKLETSARHARRIRQLHCQLQQKIAHGVTNKVRANLTLEAIEDKAPTGLPIRRKGRSMVLYEFLIPTHKHLIPSFLSGCTIVQAAYAVIMVVKFNGCGGKLIMEVPIGIGPETDPVNLENTNAVPVFNRPKRFPNFSPSSDKIRGPYTETNGDLRRDTSNRVNSKYDSALCCF
ncbi:hypothetical protein CHS0354_008783 [Potamilus streckersoni]|uniref:Arrestin C-terminal-like domain-containing protein n=1 Tax=Potamilus streckersoni TaxID=2493646 RepID=A0AAE0SPB5_9BIVA|nr:hypothetical protein CHS0354_008783 [Potamilus streckersoni]